METLRYTNSQAYLFPNKDSKKLIIVIEGSGWSSVLGEKQNNIWVSVQYGAQFLQVLSKNYTFLILEKLNRQPGMVYFEDMEDRANYTAENLIACYTESINSFLADHSFSTIVLIAESEGAALLPLVYEKIDNKDKIIAMVSISFGGLSMYESYSILASSRSGFPQEWLGMFSNMLSVYNPENNEFPNSFSENYYNVTYRWFSSFVHIRPIDYYKNIDVPILFVHGISDYYIPVESTAYIQENLPEKPFEYKYFQWDHQPRNKQDTLQFRKELAEWILKIDN
jgi:pimeloyl-ACP methyl ester carboxylesterase